MYKRETVAVKRSKVLAKKHIGTIEDIMNIKI